MHQPETINASTGRASATPTSSAEHSHIPPKPPRSQLIDTVKGLAITLVALGHTNQGEIARGWWGTSSFGLHLNAFIYAFHMPAFFFVSGALLIPSVERRGDKGFLAQKARTLLYPFLLWSVLMPTAEHLLAHFKRAHPPDLRSSLLNLVTGSNAWFLPALFLALTLGMLLRRVPAPVLLLIACTAALFCPPTHLLALDRAIAYLPFVAGGMMCRRSLKHFEQLPAGASLPLALTLTAVLYVASAHITNPGLIRWLLLPAGFTGTAMLLLLARSVEGTPAGQAGVWVGTASIAVFLLAPFPQGAVRLLLQTVHCTEPFTQLLFPSLAAIALSAWIYHQRRKLHLSVLFAWPAPSSASAPKTKRAETA